MADDLDYTDRYNTYLEPYVERAYQDWTARQNSPMVSGPSKGNYDYDMRGWYESHPGRDLADGHLTDQFKKPNHPTFSTGSQYHGQDGNVGGEWARQKDDTWSFKPGSTNMQMHGVDGLQDYFGRIEKGNRLEFQTTPVEHNPYQTTPVEHNPFE